MNLRIRTISADFSDWHSSSVTLGFTRIHELLRRHDGSSCSSRGYPWLQKFTGYFGLLLY
jgi:hypothetical protein